jgi:hypothetical protein
MPLYEDLVRRAIEARDRAESLALESRRVTSLAATLRAADAGEIVLVRCAWCDRLRLGDEWLHLRAIGRGQEKITASILKKASHGICPDCLSAELLRSAKQRASS